eukprot:CAMPEP_0179037448 /NCGR_PEP_ID=MMETSP0796-20121207/14134_1 /TAXON_ID=73915 /ORGANISM="Pyrodinium bahamense, Strain pbaha01" /LENGTH=693 /DNA_ID=CAMNT_0020733757 /DNA_START=42 /DNA_END=2123 /DNA_ORIENTATION=+
MASGFSTVPVSALSTFAYASGPTPSTLLRGASAQGAAVTPAPATSAGPSAAAAASLATAAIAAGSLLAAPRSRRGTGATARRAEKVFAGGLIGGESAFGNYNFDPLDLAEKCPQFLPWFREAELKHGRIAMLAFVGLVVPESARIPGPAGCYTASVVNAHNACVGEDNLGPLFQVFLFCGVIEMLSTFPKCTQGLTLENAGDYRLGVNFLPADEAKAKEMKLKELKNGRLAMMAFGGAITQAVLSGNGFPWLYARGQCSAGPGLASSVPLVGAGQARGSSRVAMCAEGGYKMSKAVPFLPVSPALEGYAGEEDGFDPMGFSLAFDIRWLREAELKHGRVCMLATLGWIATDLGLRVPGEPFQVSTVDAHDAMVKFGSMPQMLCWIGYAELFGFLAIINMMEGKTDRKPGDFGLRWLYPKDEQGQSDMQLKELRNGRLAMLAYGGIVTAAVLTGKTWPFFATEPDRSLAAPRAGSALCGGLRKPATRGGSVAAHALEASKSLPFLPKPQNLKGFVGEEQEFDPLGFSDTFDMKWLREAELKHGRVCMLATLGFVTQQFVTLPGMQPTPDALQAVYTAPPAAMATLLFLAGYAESAAYGGKLTMLDMFEDSDREPGDLNFGTRFLAGKSEQEIYDTKLKELNNGRLAMMAFGGMVHHNLVVNGPLFPLFPEGWVGPQNTWQLDSVMGNSFLINSS